MDSDLVGERFELWLPVPRRVGLAVEIVERLAIPKRSLAVTKERRVASDGDRIGGVRLQLHRVGPGVFRNSNELFRFFEPLVVVGRDFGNDVRRLPRADGPPLNRKRRGHDTFLALATRASPRRVTTILGAWSGDGGSTCATSGRTI